MERDYLENRIDEILRGKIAMGGARGRKRSGSKTRKTKSGSKSSKSKSRSKRSGAAKSTNPWIRHVKKFAREHGISYAEALQHKGIRRGYKAGVLVGAGRKKRSGSKRSGSKRSGSKRRGSGTTSRHLVRHPNKRRHKGSIGGILQKLRRGGADKGLLAELLKGLDANISVK